MRGRFIPAMTVLLLAVGAASAQAPADGGAWSAPAAPEDHFRASAEYLLWSLRGGVPADLRGVTAGAGIDSGSLLSTLPLNSWRSGVRGFVSFAPADDCWPVFELGGFALENLHGSFDASVTTHPAANPAGVPAALMLGPVVNGVIVVPDSHGIVDSPIPGPNGSVDLDESDTLTTHLRGTSQRELWGLEANLHSRPCYFGCLRFDGLVGFRYVTLREKLNVQGDYTFREPPAGGDADETDTNPEDNHTNVMHTFDSIEIRNNFYGGQIGTSFEARVCDCIVISGFAKFAAGGNSEKVTMRGVTVLDATTIETNAGGPFVPRPTTVLPGGLFTPQVPGGTVTRTTHLSVLPDLNINVGYQITPYLQAYVGYNYMFLSNVARLGTQSLVFGNSTQDHLSLHGVDIGVQFRY
jgi:hypothetical protein